MTGYSLLNGVTVLEVAKLAPSSVGGHLADLGAEVIRIETDDFGDPVRGGSAVAIGDPDGPSFMYLRWNRGKKSVRLDLGSREGVDAFLKLAATADAVIEGTRSGFLESRGLGPDTLRQVNPAIVFCAISGTGSTGPYRKVGTGGPIFDAYAGLRKLEDRGEPPTGGVAGSTQAPYAMYAIGAYGAMAALAAILQARSTGVGKTVEIAGLDIASTWMPDAVDAALNHSNLVPRPSWLPDGRLPDWPRLEAYPTKDEGAVVFGAHVPKFWANFCNAVGRSDLLEIELDRVDEGAASRADHVWRELCTIFKERTRQEWLDLFVAADIAGGPMYTIDEMVADPHFRSRANTYTVHLTGVGEVELAASPVRVVGEDFAPALAPVAGIDTEDILGRLK